MEALHVETLDGQPPDSPAWDACVTAARSKHLEQTTAWAAARRFDGWFPTYLLVRRGANIVGGALILTRCVKRFIRVGYVSRGPFILTASPEEEREIAKRLLDELTRFARTRRLLVLIVDPPYSAGSVPELMARAGFSPHIQQLPPTGLMKGTLLIDLRVPEEELLRGIRRSTRQVLRKAERDPAIRFREGGVQDIDMLWRLMNELCRRRGVQPNVSSPAVMRALWERLSPTKNVRIDLLEHNGEPLTAVLTVCLGGWAIPWRIGWSGAQASLSPEKILYWHLIRAVKRAGYTTFDFNWIDPEEGEAIRAGSVIDSTPHTGVTAFKIGFGGEIVRLAPPMEFFPSRLLRVMRQVLGLVQR